jgi:hypothetical protein
MWQDPQAGSREPDVWCDGTTTSQAGPSPDTAVETDHAEPHGPNSPSVSLCRRRTCRHCPAEQAASSHAAFQPSHGTHMSLGTPPSATLEYYSCCIASAHNAKQPDIQHSVKQQDRFSLLTCKFMTDERRSCRWLVYTQPLNTSTETSTEGVQQHRKRC